jgi:tRNA(Ile)-lysidine synthase TilS/MesJ
LWCVRKGVPTIDDPSNDDTKYRRNYIRHTIMPHVLAINPGIKKTIKKKVLDSL